MTRQATSRQPVPVRKPARKPITAADSEAIIADLRAVMRKHDLSTSVAVRYIQFAGAR